MEKTKLEKIVSLFKRQFLVDPSQVLDLDAHASKRKMARLIHPDGSSYIGVYNDNPVENEAFVSFGKTFDDLGLAVPKIIAEDLADNIYLQQDLGDTTLRNVLDYFRSDEEPFPDKVKELYKKSLTDLIKFQVEGGKKIDYSKCEIHKEYGKESMLGDMNYFAEEFLARHEIDFDQDRINQDFENFSNFLLKAPIKHFCYRDFQARNIMVTNDSLYFIDFQGGRKGAVHWDVVSLLYQSSANIPQEARDKLGSHYVDELLKVEDFDRAEFNSLYDGFILIRMLQVLGAYGKHGLGEGKEYFLKSIPFALKNINRLIKKNAFPKDCKELKRVLEKLMTLYL